MGISFSASLFGLAGSLILGFLDLQAGQAQGRFYTELEDWLAATTATGEAALTDPAGCRSGAREPGGRHQRARAEHAIGAEALREWMETQAARDRDIRAVLERFARERAH
jgi:hypothetical protein